MLLFSSFRLGNEISQHDLKKKKKKKNLSTLENLYVSCCVVYVMYVTDVTDYSIRRIVLNWNLKKTYFYWKTILGCKNRKKSFPKPKQKFLLLNFIFGLKKKKKKKKNLERTNYVLENFKTVYFFDFLSNFFTKTMFSTFTFIKGPNSGRKYFWTIPSRVRENNFNLIHTN